MENSLKNTAACAAPCSALDLSASVYLDLQFKLVRSYNLVFIWIRFYNFWYHYRFFVGASGKSSNASKLGNMEAKKVSPASSPPPHYHSPGTVSLQGRGGKHPSFPQECWGRMNCQERNEAEDKGMKWWRNIWGWGEDSNVFRGAPSKALCSTGLLNPGMIYQDRFEPFLPFVASLSFQLLYFLAAVCFSSI